MKKLNLFFGYGHEAVDIFFLLSAVVMCMAYEKYFTADISVRQYGDFMYKRLIRLYPVYLFWLFCYEAIARNFKPLTLVFNILLIQNLFRYETYLIAGVFWSLCSEWIMYFIFPLLIFFFKKINSPLVLIGVIFASIFLHSQLPHFTNYYFTREGVAKYENMELFTVIGTNSILRCFFCYLMGISGYLLIQKARFRDLLTKLPSGNFIFSAILIISFFQGMKVFIVFLSCILILQLFVNENNSIFKNRIIYFLGKISYSMYLCHMFIISSLSIILKKILGVYIMEQYQPYIITIAFVLLVPISYLSYIFWEQKISGGLRSKKKINFFIPLLKIKTLK